MMNDTLSLILSATDVFLSIIIFSNFAFLILTILRINQLNAVRNLILKFLEPIYQLMRFLVSKSFLKDLMVRYDISPFVTYLIALQIQFFIRSQM